MATKRSPALGVSPKLSSLPEPNSLYYILKETKLSSYKLNLTQRDSIGHPIESGPVYEPNSSILTDLGHILSDRNLRRSAFYALDAGALTGRILKEVLGLNHTASIRAIQELTALGILSPSLPIHRPRGAKGGPRVTVYQTPEATSDQVAQTCELQRRLEAPKYRVALRYTQVILEEYLEPRHLDEITYRDLLDELRVRKVPEYIDVADMTAQLLVARGVKVWR